MLPKPYKRRDLAAAAIERGDYERARELNREMLVQRSAWGDQVANYGILPLAALIEDDDLATTPCGKPAPDFSN